jgi:hypothetical protein
MLSETLLEAFRVARIRSADDPDGARLPALDRLAQKEASSQKGLETRSLYHSPALDDCLSRSGACEIRRLAMAITQEARQPVIFVQGEDIPSGLPASRYQRRGEE